MKTYKISRKGAGYSLKISKQFNRDFSNKTIYVNDKKTRLKVDKYNQIFIAMPLATELDLEKNNRYSIEIINNHVYIDLVDPTKPKKKKYKLSMTNSNLSIRIPTEMEEVPVGVIDVWIDEYCFPLDIPHQGNVTLPRALKQALNLKHPTYVDYVYHEDYGALEIVLLDKEEKTLRNARKEGTI